MADQGGGLPLPQVFEATVDSGPRPISPPSPLPANAGPSTQNHNPTTDALHAPLRHVLHNSVSFSSEAERDSNHSHLLRSPPPAKLGGSVSSDIDLTLEPSQCPPRQKVRGPVSFGPETENHSDNPHPPAPVRKPSRFPLLFPGTENPRSNDSSEEHHLRHRPSVMSWWSATNTTAKSKTPSIASLRYYMEKPVQEHYMPIYPDADPDEMREFLETVKTGHKPINKWRAMAFRILWFGSLLCILYFVFIGRPLWDGFITVFWNWLTSATGPAYGFLIFFLFASTIAWLPLLGVKFEKNVDDVEKRDASQTCLIIPAYKAAAVLPETIEHALKIFKPYQIFIIANGNSPDGQPLDNTEEICKRYRVRHAFMPIGSKITAEYVGVLLAREFKYCLLIDDDVHLPPDLPLVTDRITADRINSDANNPVLTKGGTACIGYLIKSTGANGSKGTMVQQAQDLEYKLSGLSRSFAGTYGSSTFPHGAIILWNRHVLETLFWGHPGFTISEDWYFGHTCRAAGYRIEFCTQVFVETETPPNLFIPSKSSRGGYGEMTVWKQRFYRWNFFYPYRIRDNVAYIFFGWRLGFREIVTKFFVFIEIYATVVFASRPFMLPIALAAQPRFAGIMTASMIAMYIMGVCFFNAVHLRRKKQMVSWKVIPVYIFMKWALMFVNTVGIYYALYAYAGFFSKQHLRVIENYEALIAAKECLAKVDRELKEARERGEDVGPPPGAGRTQGEGARVVDETIHNLVTQTGKKTRKKLQKRKITRKAGQRTVNGRTDGEGAVSGGPPANAPVMLRTEVGEGVGASAEAAVTRVGDAVNGENNQSMRKRLQKRHRYSAAGPQSDAEMTAQERNAGTESKSRPTSQAVKENEGIRVSELPDCLRPGQGKGLELQKEQKRNRREFVFMPYEQVERPRVISHGVDTEDFASHVEFKYAEQGEEKIPHGETEADNGEGSSTAAAQSSQNTTKPTEKKNSRRLEMRPISGAPSAARHHEHNYEDAERPRTAP